MAKSMPTCPFVVGQIIRERHIDGQDRRVTAVSHGYVHCVGVASGRETRIAWKNLKRYDAVTKDHDV